MGWQSSRIRAAIEAEMRGGMADTAIERLCGCLTGEEMEELLGYLRSAVVDDDFSDAAISVAYMLAALGDVAVETGMRRLVVEVADPELKEALDRVLERVERVKIRLGGSAPEGHSGGRVLKFRPRRS